MPHCVLWSDADWHFAVDTGRVHAAFVNGDLRMAPELRLREAAMGVMWPSRQQLRIRYVRAEEEVSAPEVMHLVDYKALLDGLVPGDIG
jgi:hypothetical protein